MATITSEKITKHSVKVPQLYKKAQKILADVITKKSSLKNTLYNTHHPRIGALSSLVHETLRKIRLIDELIELSGLKKETKLDSNLARILVCELLFGKKSLPESSKPVKTVLSYHENLQKELQTYSISKSFEENKPAFVPRYVRVNTLKISVENAVENFIKEHFVEIKLQPGISYEKYKDALKFLKPKEFVRDPHIPDLLVFHSKIQLHDHHLYKKHEIILQDKSSCFPPMLLNPPPGSIVLDACAAPGMKTSYLTAIMKNTGKILAIDKDNDRASSLRTIIENSGAECVQVECKDFTHIDHSKAPYNKVEYILVDPSCSGSGIPFRKFENTTKDPERLRSLSYFQFKILSHALSFPAVKRVVYSTCSVYPEENEDVVQQTLKFFGDRFELERALPQWHRRAFYGLEGAVRMDLEKDYMCGFFIAVFRRKSPDTEEPPTEEEEPRKKPKSRQGRKSNQEKKLECPEVKELPEKKKEIEGAKVKLKKETRKIEIYEKEDCEEEKEEKKHRKKEMKRKLEKGGLEGEDEMKEKLIKKKKDTKIKKKNK